MTNNTIFKLILIFSFGILFFNTSFNILNAEETSSISSDRPGQAMTPITLSPGNLQIQSGIYYNNSKYSFPYNEGALVFGFPFDTKFKNYYTNQVIRFGLSDNLEFNANLNYIQTNFQTNFAFNNQNNIIDTALIKESYNGINSLNLGVRYNLTKNNSDNSFAIQSNLGVYQSKDFNQEKIYPLSITAIYLKKLNKDFNLNINLGNTTDLNFDGLFINSTNINYVINLGYSINSDLGVFIENYGSYNINEYKNNYISHFDTGFYYLINNNLQLDFYGGSFLTASRTYYLERTYFIGTGISYRFNQNK